MNIIQIIPFVPMSGRALPFLALIPLLIFGDCGVAASPDEMAKCYSDQGHFIIASFSVVLAVLTLLAILAWRIARARNLNKN